MSAFIIPMGNLPSLQSLQQVSKQQETQTAGHAGMPFGNLLENAMNNLAETGEVNQQNIYSLAMGQNDDLHTGSIAALKSSVAVNFASSLTSSAIKAYNELMRMQI